MGLHLKNSHRRAPQYYSESAKATAGWQSNGRKVAYWVEWWTNPLNKQRPKPHVIIELPSLARVNSRAQICEFYKDGLSLREIGKRVGVPKTTLRETTLKDGIAIRNFSKNQKNRSDLEMVMRSGGTPFGYTYLEGKLVIDPREYKTVIEMVRLRKSGKSLRAIARTLNDRNIPTRFGKSWKHEVIKSIIERQQKVLDGKSGGRNETR